MTDKETILILNKMMNDDSVLREIKKTQALQQAIKNTEEKEKYKQMLERLSMLISEVLEY